VLDHSGPAGNSAALRRLSQADCLDCDAIADFIDSVNRNGGRISGLGWQVLNTRVIAHEQDTVEVRTTVRINPQAVVMRRGKVAKRYPGGQRVKTFQLTASKHGWKVSNLDQGTA
jgi:hypothetical protein